MPQSKQTKGGGKDEGGQPTIPTPEELAKQAEEMPIAGHLARMIKQDLQDGVDDAHLPYGKPEEELFGDAERDHEVPAQEGSGAATGHGDQEAAEDDAVPDAIEDTGAEVAESDALTVGHEQTNGSATHKSVVRAINREVTVGLEATAAKIGDLALDAICKGDVRFTLSDRLGKSAAYRRVSNDPDLNLDPKRLSEFMRMAAFKRLLLQNGDDVSNLPPSKLIAMLPVKDEDLRVKLAREANERNYSVRQIRTLVKGFIPRKHIEDIGKTIIRKLGAPLQMLNDDDLFTVCTDRQILMRDLSSAERRKILDQIREGKPRLKALDALVETLEATLEAIEDES